MKTSWSQIILELEGAGIRSAHIARSIGMSKSGLSEIKSGRTKEPRGDFAVALKRLHQIQTRKARAKQARVA